MKKYIFIFFFLSILFSLSAQVASDLETQLDFDLSLKDLVIMVESNKSNEIDMNQYIILDGVVSAREVLYADEESFVGMFEISYGEWEGLENVTMYKCFVQVQGLEFASMIPVRRSRTPNPAEILLNTHILVMGKYLGYSEDETGQKYPVVEGIKVRKIN
ncbi:MAG: hypothetical protein PF693_18735 [Spirochaetia bacterium]|jgi:hypothetical protein|nr:hypothetical protein [Spirochaetia bacterium]